MKIMLYGKEINKFDDIVEAVYDEIMENDYHDCEGNLPTIDDISDLHDFCCDEFETDEEYKEFERILDNAENFDGIEFDTGDSMYHMSGGGFSSWSDYYSYRFG